ncbi:MAG TPA: phosphatase PAP2 family protein [Acidimicrobiales bacterium]|nr:phosphatase PAP2 family protein [Acidimicrobiales bacterium]
MILVSRTSRRAPGRGRPRRPVALVVAMALVAGACGGDDDTSSDATTGTTAAGVEAAHAEPTAGDWKTWVLTSPEQFQVPPPPGAGSAEEKAEDAELRKLVTERTPEVADFVRKWSGDGEPISAPWMGSALEFISAREKDPAASSRAYALVAVAAYDAMVATWHYKYKYDRKAPDVVPKLAEAGPDPSYPNEHAAIAQATASVLAYVFPERPALRLQEDADQAADSRVLAGAARRSDVDAGLALGQKVAEAVITHAKADGSDAVWDGKRPGGRPRYWEPPTGKVANPVSPLAGTWKTWVMKSGDQFRPPPPPVFGSPEFTAAAKEVVAIQQNLTEEQRKAAVYWAGGQGTPLPAGIWNEVTLAYLRDLRPSEPQAERVMALANVAMADAGVAAWDTKYAYWDPRPENGIQDSGVDPNWKPLFDTPFFPSYISGHATYSAAIAEVLSFVFPKREKDFRAKALEASNSRAWGGIHWPLDSTVGMEVGSKIGKLVIEYARTDGAPDIT